MAELPTIETERLILRPFVAADAPEVARLAGTPEIASTTLLIPHPYTVRNAQDWLATHRSRFEGGRGLDLAVTMRDAGELCGAVGLGIERDHDRAELGYWIGTEYWGRGYASEAGAAVVAWAFEHAGLHRVFAYHFARNPSSGRVLQKIGMKPEGVSRGHVKKLGVYEDCVLYGVLRGEFGNGGTGPGERP